MKRLLVEVVAVVAVLAGVGYAQTHTFAATDYPNVFTAQQTMPSALVGFVQSETTNPASVGIVRLAKTDCVDWANHDNSVNLGLCITGGDQLAFNGTTIGPTQFVGMPTGSCTASQTAVDTTSGSYYTCNNGTWLLVGPGAAGSAAFNTVTGGTNTGQNLIVGNGSLLSFVGSGVVNANQLNGNAPGGTCTNQFTRSIDSSGRPTCSAVSLANDITGNLGVTHLNSGTGATTSTFWRGDGTWGVPPGSVPTGVQSQLLGYGITASPTPFTGPTYPAALYGVVANGSDQCANVPNLMAAANATGGTILFDAGTTLFATCNLTGSNAPGANVFLAGRGAAQSDTSTPATPQSVLLMTFAGADVAHIECLVIGGQCGGMNLTVQDNATSLPFWLFTGGIPILDNVTCWGQTSRVGGGQPVNDCVWLGNGTSSTCHNPSIATDGVCDYGNNHGKINISAHNVRRAVVFGSNANTEDVSATGDFTDAYVNGSLVPQGGFVEFNAASSGVAAYGNHVHITNVEMAPFGDATHCNYLGAVRFVANSNGNDVDYAASDMGNCAYSAYVVDATSTPNRIKALTGLGSSGTVSDPTSNQGVEIDSVATRTYQNRIIIADDFGITGNNHSGANFFYANSGGMFLWLNGSGSAADTNFSRDSAGVVDLGNGTASSKSGTLQLTSVLATGVVDGQEPVVIDTTTPVTVGTTFQHSYHFNQNATAATSVFYNLPTAAAGRRFCFANSNNGSAADTGALKIQTSAVGQFIIASGVLSANNGYIISSGMAGDGICVVGVDATHWQVDGVPTGLWSLH